VTLHIDILFANRILHFGTVEALKSRQHDEIKRALNNIKQQYLQRGFIINMTNMDQEFAPLKHVVNGLQMGYNDAGSNEHVPRIERYIRVVKERARAAFSALPFKKIPSAMVVELLLWAVFWLNSFPNRRGVSKQLSPRTIVTGQAINCRRHAKYEFGQYVHVHEPSDNSMSPRTVGALAMRPSGYEQGSWLFFSLKSGRIVVQNHATLVPIPDDATDQVHNWVRRQGTNRGLIFGDRNGLTVVDDIVLDDDEDNDDDPQYIEDEDEIEDDDNTLQLQGDGHNSMHDEVDDDDHNSMHDEVEADDVCDGAEIDDETDEVGGQWNVDEGVNNVMGQNIDGDDERSEILAAVGKAIHDENESVELDDSTYNPGSSESDDASAGTDVADNDDQPMPEVRAELPARMRNSQESLMKLQEWWKFRKQRTFRKI
jgi:hypothetical protein